MKMHLPNRVIWIILVSLFVFAEVAAVYLSLHNYTQNKTAYIEKKSREFEISLQASLNHFERRSLNYYNELVKDSGFAQLLQSANGVDAIQKETIRQQIIEKSAVLYEQLKADGMPLFSFFFADNINMVRLHELDIFDDNVTDVRPLIRTVNSKRIPQKGFETGCASAGYYFVYPLYAEGHYVGCVEFGVDFMAIRNDLMRIFPYEFVFLIDKESVLQSTPYVKLVQYNFSDLSEEFFYEKRAQEGLQEDTTGTIPVADIIEFNKVDKDLIEKNLNKRDLFAHGERLDNGRKYLALFVPLKSFSGSVTAFLIAYANDGTLMDYQKDLVIILIIAVTALLVIFLLVLFALRAYTLIRTNRDQLLESEEKLKELNIAKDKFFSIIAHDLRNPFHGLVGLSEVLMEDYDQMDTERVRRFHKLIYESSRQGYQLVLNLLEWTRVQTGRFQMKLEKISIARIISDSTNVLVNQANMKRITLRAQVNSGLFAYSDFQMTATVLRNLLSNAIKFSPEGSEVLVRATIVKGEVLIEVEDHGTGIEPNVLSQLFNIGVSHSSTGTAGETGTGLGLILAKEFVERNHGRIWAESQVGKGSIFSFTLPLYKL